jgi:2-methylcitrate dehydratase PrpD
LNATAYTDLPPRAIEHAKMILASTLSSAAAGITMDSARIQRELALEQAGKAESTV